MSTFVGSLLVMVIGISIVFICLVLLIALVSLLKVILSPRQKKRAPSVHPTPAKPQPAPEIPAPAIEISPAIQGNQDEIAAVIAAVIAAMGESVPKGALVVRKVQRVSHNTPAWNRAGRKEMMGNG